MKIKISTDFFMGISCFINFNSQLKMGFYLSIQASNLTLKSLYIPINKLKQSKKLVKLILLSVSRLLFANLSLCVFKYTRCFKSCVYQVLNFVFKNSFNQIRKGKKIAHTPAIATIVKGSGLSRLAPPNLRTEK